MGICQFIDFGFVHFNWAIQVLWCFYGYFVYFCGFRYVWRRTDPDRSSEPKQIRLNCCVGLPTMNGMVFREDTFCSRPEQLLTNVLWLKHHIVPPIICI